MQVRIIITTIAFMLTMVLLGFYTLLEQNRMQTYTLAREGRQIEAGAELYANNCVGCHGLNGKGQSNNAAGISEDQGCINPDALPGDDDEFNCLGLPLNNYGLLCGVDGTQVTGRMDSRGWPGTKEGFIRSTLVAGRAGGVMAPWAQETGGPLARNQIDNLVKYVLNYESEELCSVPLFQFPWPDALDELPTILPENIELEDGQEFNLDQLPLNLEGNIENGEKLYGNQGYNCTSCHMDPNAATNPEGSGPWHSGYATRVNNRLGEEYMLDGVPSTYDSVEEYTYRSILYPHEYLVNDYGQQYGANMLVYSTDSMMSDSPQDIVDLVAYLLSLE